MEAQAQLNYLESVRRLFQYYKKLGEQAMAQLTDEELKFQPEPESNSMATIVKHLSGNMLSRWTDFLTTDGEKPWRNRESEFEDTLEGRSQVMEAWEKGWDCVFAALGGLEEGSLQRIVYIRNEGHTVLEAVNRQLAHYSYHVGQMVFLARQIRGSEWQSLSIPKGQSEAYNEEKFAREKGRRHFS